MHFLESVEDRDDNLFDFVRLELVLGLDFVIELTSFQEFDDDVQGVI
jgi:hypothetical protein